MSADAGSAVNSPAMHHMPPIRLRKRQEWAVYLVAAVLWASGLAWLLLENYVRIESDFGPVHHWSQAWLLKLHGVLAMFAVWGFGVMWTFHIRRAWRLRRHRASGGTMFTVVLTLSLTGLLLYYAGGETLRQWSSLVHWVIGLAAGLALIVHAIIVPRRERAGR